MEFRKEVMEWISVAEHHLARELDLPLDAKSSSYKPSHASTRSRKSTASSTTSVRAKKKLRLAELQAEREMLERKQALRAADEALKLETEIAKAQARERVYASLEEDQGNLESKDDTVPDVKQSQPKFMSSTPAAPLNPGAPEFHPNSLVSKNSPQANSSITGAPRGIVTLSDIPSQPEPYEKSFEEVMAQSNPSAVGCNNDVAST